MKERKGMLWAEQERVRPRTFFFYVSKKNIKRGAAADDTYIHIYMYVCMSV